MDPYDLARTLDAVRSVTKISEPVMAAVVLAVAINDAAHTIATAIDRIETAHPLQGETFGGLTSAIESIAMAIEDKLP